jgi:predicted site-specific integrase-resolvase
MMIEEAIKFYGNGNKLCNELGIKRQNVTAWKKRGYIPYKLQIRIQELTNGKLKAGLQGI